MVVVGLRFGGGRGGVLGLITGEFRKAEGDGMVMVSISDTSCDCGNTLTMPTGSLTLVVGKCSVSSVCLLGF